MASGTRRVWRVSPPTLAVVIVFCVAAGVCVPVLAYLILVREQSPWLSAFLAALAVVAVLYGWRFGLYPSVRADEDGVVVRNPRRKVAFGWSEITVIAPGENGLLVGSEADRVEAWCIQKSRWATKRGRRTRADRIADDLFDLQLRNDPPLEDDETGIRIRRARWHEHGLLTQLERSASKAALGHVFPPDDYPYPTAAVRRRWRRILRDRMVHVRILEEFDAPVGLVAFENTGPLRHLAIAPQHARRGYGSLLLEYATQEIFDSGAPRAELWVLVENRDARAFYRNQGWEDTMERSDCEYPPYPREMQLARRNPAAPAVAPEAVGPESVGPVPAWDTGPLPRSRGRRFQGLLTSLGLLFLVPALVFTGMRLFPPTSDRVALLASFIPYGMLCYYLATPLLLIAFFRSRGARVALGVVALVTVAGLVYQLSSLLPLFVRDNRPVTTAPFTLISLNMRAGTADPAGLARQAATADVVVLVEATPDGLARLDRYDWDDRFRYVSGSTEQGDPGSVIYSRFPLSDGGPLPRSSFQQWAATAEVPEVGPVRILAVHPCNPYCGDSKWATEHATLNAVALAERKDRPLILAGDFNAIDDHGPMLALRRAGLKSVADVAGAGWLPTWPANYRVPPLLAIDHVLINDRLTATQVGTFRLKGTDHLGLQATLAGTT